MKSYDNLILESLNKYFKRLTSNYHNFLIIENKYIILMQELKIKQNNNRNLDSIFLKIFRFKPKFTFYRTKIIIRNVFEGQKLVYSCFIRGQWSFIAWSMHASRPVIKLIFQENLSLFIINLILIYCL